MKRLQILIATLRRSRVAKTLFWGLCALLCYMVTSQGIDQRQAAFRQSVQLNQTLLDSRLDYLNLFLTGLTRSSAISNKSGPDFPPFVIAAGFQPRVDTGDRDHFEDQQSYQNRHAYLIRDYRDPHSETWNDSSAWFPAPARSQYLPLASLLPEQPGNPLSYLLGLDLAADRFFAAAVRSALNTGEPQVSKPFRYRNGHPGVAVILAAYRSPQLPVAMSDRMAEATGVAIVFIDVAQLFHVPANSHLQLHIEAESEPVASRTTGSSQASWLTNRQSLQGERYHLPYLITLSQPGPDWGGMVLAGAVLLLLAGVLYYSLFRRTLSPLRGNPPPAPGGGLEHQALQEMESAVLMLSVRRQILYANPFAANLSGDPALQGKLLESVDFGICQLRSGRRIHVLPRLIEKKHKATLPAGCFLIDAHGHEHEIEGEFQPLRDPANHAAHFLLTFRPVGMVRQSMAHALSNSEAQLKKHQDELARIARINTLGEMSSGVAHEINQPLSAIMSYNEACLAMMDDVNPDPVLLRISLSSSVRQANRAGQIIRRLRELASRKQPVVAALDIHDVLNNALDLTKNELNARGVIVTCDLAPASAQVMADSIQLEQVIINLIKNAVDAMADRAAVNEAMRIFIYTERRGRDIRLGIRDNGTGIPENILPHVFDPFYSSKNEGMGLGLTISQTIVESIGGKLAARNLETGGAEFSITLPMLKSSYSEEQEELHP